MLGRKSIDLLEQGLHGFVTQGEGMAGLTTLLSSSIEIMDGMIEETSWYTTNDIICAKKKYSSTLISINLRMTQYAWKRCCWHCNIWSDWFILIWRLVETIRIGSHLDHLAENVRDDCYEFFWKIKALFITLTLSRRPWLWWCIISIPWSSHVLIWNSVLKIIFIIMS